MNSKLFIITLFAALSALVAASTATTNNEALVLKREALSARMHARAAAGHGALKKRQPTDEAKERIKRAQYHPTRTAAAAPGIEKGMEKRQFGIGLTPINVPIIGNVPIVCVDAFGQPLYIVGCPAKATASQTVCQAQPKQQCNPTYAIAGSVSNGLGGVTGGISSCCPFGYTCSRFGNLGGSYCLTPNQLTIANSQSGGVTFGSQQTIADFLNRVL